MEKVCSIDLCSVEIAVETIHAVQNSYILTLFNIFVFIIFKSTESLMYYRW